MMPDLGFTVQGMKATNYITPRIGQTPGGGLAAQLQSDSAVNQQRREAMTRNLFKTEYGEGDDGLAVRVGKYVSAAGIDLADMVGGSLVPGVDRGDLWNQARGIGLDGLADFAERNKSGVEVTSGLVAAVATAGLADALLVPLMAGRLAASTALTSTKLWKMGERTLGGAKKLASDSALAAAVDGELATVLGTTGGRALLKARVVEHTGRAAVQEAAVAAVTHSNDSMWSDDASQNLMMAALGLGLGGALGGIGARFEMRQIANSDEVMSARSAASDPHGWTALRLENPTAEEISKLGTDVAYKESANVVGLYQAARSMADESATSGRKALVEAEAKQAEIQAQRGLQKITSKGVSGVSNTSFTLDAPATRAAGAHLAEANHADPTLMLAIDEVGLGEVTRILEGRKLYIKELRKSDDAKDLRLAQQLEEQEALGLVNGSWMPDSKELRALSEYKPGEIKLTPTTSVAGNFEFSMDVGNGKFVKVNEGGNVRGFDSLELTQQLKAYEGLSAVTARMISAKQQYVIPKDATWLQLDFALNFSKKGGKLNFAKSGINGEEELMIHSLRKKAEAADAIVKSKGGLDFWDRAKLNLPLPSSLERIHDGTGDTMLKVLETVKKQQKVTIQELKDLRKQLLVASDLRDGIKQEAPELIGDMFSFNRSPVSGEWRPIVTGFGSTPKMTPELLGSKEHLLRATAENKAYRIQSLESGILSADITKTVTRSPEYEISNRLRELARDQITGAGNAFSQGMGTLVTRAMRYRDSSIMLATQRLREVIDRRTEDYTNQFIAKVFGGAQNRLASLPNQGSKTLVNQWFSYAGGWDLMKGARANGDGFYSFQLADTARNAQRLGRAVGPDDVLVSPTTGRPVVLDDTGLEYVERFQIGARQLLKDTNAVRKSRGMTPLEEKEWYVPPPNTRGKILGFTVDRNGKTVPQGAIVASTQEEFDALRKAKVAQLEAEGKGHRFYSESEIKAADDLWDLGEMGWVDPGFIGGKKMGQTGTIFGDKINPRAMEESLEWVSDKIKAIANGSVRSLYDQQLAVARARSAAESAVAGADRRTIYDEWEATILGKPLTSVKPGAGTRTVRALEETAQSLINSGWPLVRAVGATQLSQWTNDLTHRLGMSRVKGFKSFDELAEQLGPYTPYKTAMDFAESNMRVSVPPEVAAIANGINKFTASMLLRWFEFPNAAMNMLGIVTNMPSILRSPNTPLMGQLTTKGGKKVGVIDSHRILAAGFKDMLTASKHADWLTMVKNGDTSQSVAELNMQMALIDSKSSFQRVMSGDKSIGIQHGRLPKGGKELSNWVKHKGVDGLVSLATDTTESMSRAWAHFVGLRLADYNGIVGTEARHGFARSVANQAIANYNPLNKPELFQTSIGSMFGLFASYMQQYNQRLFRWMEVGDYASVGRQLATQSMLFGATSVPGYNGVEWLLQTSGIDPGENPEATLTDAIYAKYGPKVGSVIAHGGIQELPKIFGFDESVALYTRGDANFRAPTLDPTRLMAGMNVVSSIAEGAWELASKSVNAIAEDDSTMTLRYATETIARNLPNRAMKGALTVLANQGKEIDSSGQIVSETQTWLETGLRIAGLRSGRQQGEVEAYYANSSMRRRLAGRMETLRNETRAMIRAGKPFDAMSLFTKYVEKGGSPTHFKTWIQDQIKSASDSRGIRQMSESLKSPNAQMEAWRYDMR